MQWGRVEWSGVEWSGVEWGGVEWGGVECSGVEWSGVECGGVGWSGVEWGREGEGELGQNSLCTLGSANLIMLLGNTSGTPPTLVLTTCRLTEHTIVHNTYRMSCTSGNAIVTTV